MDLDSAGRRIKAARTLSDLTVPQLAERLNLPGMGAKTLGSIERGERGLRPQELAPLARALNVPERFLTDGIDPDTAGQTVDLSRALTQFCEAIRTQNSLLERHALILERIEAKLDLDTRAADHIEAATGSLDQSAADLKAAVDQTISGLQSAPRPKPRAAKKTATHRTPRP